MPRPTRKRRRTQNVDDADTGGSGSLIAPTDNNYGGSSSSPTETNNASSSLTAPAKNSYEVFLNFRGLDTRNNFTDHLYDRLRKAEIHAFRDNEEIREGEEIGPNLFAAIKNSKILIPVLSENYGTSKWCLNELVQIMECKNNNTETLVLPIFYKVEPRDVRRSFEDAFHKRESSLPSRDFDRKITKKWKQDRKITKKWKQALRQVTGLKGWVTNGYRSEVQLINSVVQRVLLELKKTFKLVIPENLTGIDSHEKKIMKIVEKNSCATLFVGIHGMGGIGKTTLAKIIYNKLSNQFEHRSFIADVRESCKVKGIDYLQSKLIFDILKQEMKVSSKDEGIMIISSQFKGKKVLILLDDVGKDVELKALAGNQSWFSSGSIIIITTRNKSILDKAGLVYQYEHKEMDRDNSLVLFSRHAFRKDSPPKKFKKLVNEVVSTTGGLPLSLEVVGSFLCGKKRKLWRGMIEKLKEVPHDQVQKRLKISYKELTYEQRQIFLDIACFFIGTDYRIASYMWEACGFFPEVEIEMLRFLSLIKIGDHHELIMHDHLRDLGRKIIRKENRMEPRKRSRLWDFKEALEVLEGNKGTKNIEAIYLSKGNLEGVDDTTNQCGNIFTGKQFKKLRNLRFLHARGAHFRGDFKGSEKLKWLHWEYYPLPFEGSNFHVKELRVLKLWGKISDKWQGWSFIKMAKKLKYLNLAHCRSLKGTSFLSAFENLEVLILQDCENLMRIDSSIGNMRSLVCLNLKGCFHLKKLPAEVGELKALKQLLLGSTIISSLPDSIWALQNLEILDIQHALIGNLPESVGALHNLKILHIHGTRIKKLPSGIGKLRKLRYLSAANCGKLVEKIPEGIYNLSSLQHLDLSFCYKLPSLSVLPSSLKYLSITCKSRRLSFSLSNLTHLKKLRLLDCKSLECFGEHPSALLEKSVNTPFELEILIIVRCRRMETLDVSQFNHLRRLRVEDCDKVLEIRGLNKLEYLESLEIAASKSPKACSIERLDLPMCKKLRILEAKSCINLIEIQGLDKLESLEGIDISGSTSIARLDLLKSEDMKIFNVKDCVGLVEIQGLDRCESLKGIDISGCTSIIRLDLPKSKDMEIINAKNCKNLVEIQGLNRLESLEQMDISGCESLEEIDISGCSSIVRLSLPKSDGLKILGDTNCQNLVNSRAKNCLKHFAEYYIQGLGRPMFEELRELYGGLYKSLYRV